MAADPITDLARRFQQGDAEAFAELVERLQDPFYRVAYRVVGDSETALDAVQDAFVKVHRSIASWDGESRFTAWCYRIVTNVAIAGLRRRGREQRACEGKAVEQPTFQEDDADAGLVAQEQRELVARVSAAIAELPAGQRAIVALRHYEGLSLKEIADVRGCALGTVKSTLHQAFRSLRRSLGVELLQRVGEDR